MPGSFSVEPEPIPLSRPAKALAVFRRTDVGGGSIKYKMLPNIRVLSITASGQGAKTGSARFRYAFGDPLGDPYLDPRRFEHVYPLDASGDRVVKNDDRLVVRAMAETGEHVIMFDGFVQTPQADLNAMTETATFEAAGTPIKEWSIPLGGPIMRDADDPMEGEDHYVSALRTRFNPDGQPNCTPEDADSGDIEGSEHPKFIGPIWPKNEIHGETIRYWTLANAAKYIIVQGNPSQEFTSYGGLEGLTSRLVSVRPKEDGGIIDWDDPETYETEDIEVEDMDVTGAAWPEALERLLEPHGFAMRFSLSDRPGEIPEDSEEESVPTDPDWRLEIYRLDRPTNVKSLKLQMAGEQYDPAKTNVKELKLARDTSDVENLVILDTAPKLIEASFVLAPNFEPDSDDVNHIENFEGEDPPENYREWIFDECGEGHYDLDTELWVMDDAGDFTKVLMGDDEEGERRNFVRRRRPGISKLVTMDAHGKSLTWRLHVSKDYAGVMPGVWDGTGTWQEVSTSEWSLMEDRLGVRFAGQTPNGVRAGVPPEGETVAYDTGGLLNLVDWCATPTAAMPFPKFRLTCTIQADEDMGIQADWRQSVSITDRPIVRHHDVRDRFRQRIVSQHSALSSLNFGEDPGFDHFQENDEGEAQAYADAIRKARESGAFAGTVALHGIRLSYEVGDKIDGILGRGVSLRSNLGESEAESPVYPTVVDLRWDCDGEQKTILQIQDLRAEPPARRRRVTED